MDISAKSEIAKMHDCTDKGGFILPAVVMLMLLLLMFGVGRLAAYRFLSISRIELQKKAQGSAALASGMSYLVATLAINSNFTHTITSLWINSELSYSVSGDGHRFEVSAFRQGTVETARAELVVYDTTSPTNSLIVNGIMRVQ